MLTIVQRGQTSIEKPTEIVRREASRQPWAWDGLCFGVPFHDPTRDSARDIVINIAPATVTSLTWTRDDRGNAVAGLGASSNIKYLDQPTHINPSSAITVYVRFKRLGTGDAAGGIFAKNYATTTPFNSWSIRHSDAAGNKLAGTLAVDGVQTYWQDNVYVVPTTTWLNVFLRWSTGTTPILQILNDRGQMLSTASSAGGALTGTISYVAGMPIRINASSDANVNYNCDYSQALLWSRRLTDTELQALATDPYGWYSPRRETVVVAGAFPFVPGASEMRMTGMTGGGL